MALIDRPDLLDPSTFAVPELSEENSHVLIEFCNRCRWIHRASWVQTELFATFAPPVLSCVTLIPRTSDETAGRWRIWLRHGGSTTLIWDRKVEGGFGEMKEIKQRVRDIVQPELHLGHSDKKTVEEENK